MFTVEQWAQIAAAIAVTIVGTIKLWGSRFIEGRVAHQFARQLADHQAELKKEEEKFKNELGLITEGAKFNYSRQLSEFNLFVKEKHRVYAELYRGIRQASDLTAKLQKETWWYAKYDAVTVEDIAVELEELGVPIPERGDIINNWDSTNFTSDGVKLLTESLARKARRDAKDGVNRAQDCHLHEALFLSDRVDQLATTAIVLTASHVYQGPNGEHEHYERLTALKQLRDQMKLELAAAGLQTTQVATPLDGDITTKP
jgi:hypothetical protein